MPTTSTFSARPAKPHAAAPLVVSAERLSLHDIILPLTPAHRLGAALAGVLEEQLLDDPQDLHFALAPNSVAAMKAGRAVQVMVCNKAWLAAQCDQARRAGHSVSRIVPDTETWQAAGWDLAQFDFKPQSSWSYRLQGTAREVWHAPSWRWARIAAALLLVIQIAGINLWAWQERSLLQAKRAEISRILLQSFPDTTAVVDAPLQMQRGVALLRSKSAVLSGTDLETQLAKAQSGVQQIDFANGQLRSSP